MERHLLNLLTALSLLLCIAACGLWVRSYWVSEDVYPSGFSAYQRYGPVGWSFGLRSAAGGLRLDVGSPDEPPSPQETERLRANFPERGHEVYHARVLYPRLRIAPGFSQRRSGPAPPPPPEPLQPRSWRWVGVDWKVDPSITDFGSYTVYRIVFPYWMPVSLLAVLPAIRIVSASRRYRSRSRSTRGQCVRCGYDLRATPGRCPECGELRNRGEREA